ncbi:unnamed protein product [Ostreobium quekettii]|uniref:RING-type domain-containing protein n=1 Tax=Ostreobium quekettii TaxID=121088 RepID=A0A8S1J082_9CHLO|nr:unnamed protein product [Ostreobium quekettii]
MATSKLRHRSEKAVAKKAGCIPGDEGCTCPKCRFGAPMDSSEQEKRLNDIATWLCIGPDSESEPTKQELKKWNKTAVQLCKLAQAGEIDKLEELLGEQDCDDEIMTQISSELVIVASQFGRLETLKVLKDSWLADLNYQSNRGRTERGRSALMYAASKGHVPIVRYLLEDEDVNIDCADEGRMTALMVAAFSNRNAVAQVLLEEGADVHLADNRGRTALSYAAMYGNVETINLLCEHGSSLYHQDHDGKKPLELAQCHNRCGHVVEAIKKCSKKEELRRERERRKNKSEASQGRSTGAGPQDLEQADQNMARLLRELEEEEMSKKKKQDSKKAQKKRRSGFGLNTGLGGRCVDDGDVGWSTSSALSNASNSPARSMGVDSYSPDRGGLADSNRTREKGQKPSRSPGRAEPKAASLSMATSLRFLNPHTQVTDTKTLREYWNVILEDANKCVEEEQQAQYTDLLSELMQRCREAGISVKQGKKVLGRLEKVGGARAELFAAVSDSPVDLHRVDTALREAKQVKNLIDPKLWARAEALMHESGAQCVQNRDAVISSLVHLSVTSTEGAVGRSDVSPQTSAPSPPEVSSGMNKAPTGPQTSDGLDSLRKDIECVVCLFARRSACSVPCGHICMCYACAMEVQRKRGVCPLCRGNIEFVMQIM